MTNVEQILELARKHAIATERSGKSSAAFCSDDAAYYLSIGRPEIAKCRALKSIAYSVGILHADYKLAFELGEFEKPVRLLPW